MLNSFFKLIYPDYCCCCENTLAKGERLICLSCRYELPQTLYHQFPDNPLSRKFWGRVPVQHCVAFLKFLKISRVQKLLHLLKYEGVEEISYELGAWYGSVLKDGGFNGQYDLCVPVPLHPAKERKRGYNQCKGFAEELAKQLSIPYSHTALRRKADKLSFTKQNRSQRLKSSNELYCVAEPECVYNKKVLIVDDVITTGATMEACASLLLKAGASQIGLVAMATVD